MKTCVPVILLYACVIPISGNTNSNSLEELVCQKCKQKCGTNERNFMREPGISGNQGSTPRGTGGVINITMIEEIVDNKIKIALQSAWPRSCRDVDNRFVKIRNDTGGVYNLFPLGLREVEVYCDQNTDGGGWTVFQRRRDGSVDFFRGWNDYVNGFGPTNGEFWLGLETIYQMTKNGDHELRIDMIRTDGTWQYAKYRSFSVGPASDNYRLSVGGHSGNATDRLSWHTNMQFSTKERDNDRATKDCASTFTGAWWYKDCHHSNLNGAFGGTTTKGIWWHPKNMRFTEMKFRKRE